MSSEPFFTSLQEQFDKKLPFVAYSKPKSFQIRALLQKDQTLHKIEDYAESGFVFSPFDIRKDAILIPLGTSKTLMTEDDVILDDFEIKNSLNLGDKENHIKLVNKGIEAIKKNDIAVTIYSDSKYVVDSVEKGWIWNWQKKNFAKKGSFFLLAGRGRETADAAHGGRRFRALARQQVRRGPRSARERTHMADVEHAGRFCS